MKHLKLGNQTRTLAHRRCAVLPGDFGLPCEALVCEIDVLLDGVHEVVAMNEIASTTREHHADSRVVDGVAIEVYPTELVVEICSRDASIGNACQ